MKALVQRVIEASVSVNQQTIGRISNGLLLFLGVHKEDTSSHVDKLVDKILKLRIFSDENDKMNQSLLDVNGDILIVSQFTLYGDCLQGNRPSFINSAKRELAFSLYEEFINQMKDCYKTEKIQTGQFGADMKVSFVNDGPVTFMIEI